MFVYNILQDKVNFFLHASSMSSFPPSSPSISTYMSNFTKSFNRLFHRLRPQSKSLLGADSRDEILTQLNAADEPTPDIGTPRPRNSITLPPFDVNTTMCLGRPHPVTRSYRSRHHNCHTFTPPSRFTHPISCHFMTKEVPGNRSISSEHLEILDITFQSSWIARRRGGPERADGDGSPGSRRVRPD